MKSLVYLGAIIGGAVGGYIPVLFGDNGFSMLSIVTSLIGGLLGIYIGYKIQDNIDS